MKSLELHKLATNPKASALCEGLGFNRVGR